MSVHQVITLDDDTMRHLVQVSRTTGRPVVGIIRQLVTNCAPALVDILEPFPPFAVAPTPVPLKLPLRALTPAEIEAFRDEVFRKVMAAVEAEREAWLQEMRHRMDTDPDYKAAVLAEYEARNKGSQT